MVVSFDVSVRELRNHTKRVVERIEDGSTMYLTKNGERIAKIAPLAPKTWSDLVDEVLGTTAYDSGLAELLDEDDCRSADFDDDHLGSAE